MNVVGKVSSFFATPFHPFGGAVDIIVVKQQDGTFRSTPWYVRFGKFQGVLKGAEKVVRIEVNGVEADFHMYLDNSGEAYFVREDNSDKDKTNESLKDGDNLDGTSEMNDSDQTYHDNALPESSFLRQEAEDLDNIDVDVRDERVTLGMDRLERTESDTERMFYEFQDEQSSQEGSSEISEYGSSRYDNLDSTEHVIESENLSSEVVLVSVDGHVLTAPISSENLQENTPKSNVSRDEGESEGNTPVFNVNRDEGESEGNTPVFNVNRDEGESEGEVDNGNIASKHELQPCEGDDEHQHHMQETQDTAYQDRNICSSENIPSSSFKKEEVFKSCLELPKLAMQSLSADERSTRSSSEVSESPHESSPLKPKTNDESEENADERRLRSSSQVSESPHESSPLKPYTNDESQENDDEQSTRSSSEVSESPHESSPLKPKTDDESEENANERSMRSSSEVSESPHESSPLKPKTNDESEENADERSMRSSSEVSENPHEISPLKPNTNDDSEENADEQSMRSSSEVSESPHESSPLKPKTNDESEEHTGSPPSDSIYARNTSLPELRVEVAADESDAVGKDHVDSDSSPAQDDVINNQDSEKQKSVEEVATSTDECSKAEDFEPQTVLPSEDMKKDSETRMEISLCGNSLYAGMGLSAAEEAFNSNIISAEEFKLSPTSIVNNENLILRVQGKYLPRDKAAPIVLAMAVYGMDLPVQPEDAIPIEQGSREMREDESGLVSTPSGRRWRLWPIPFRKVKTLDHSGSNSSNEEIFVDSESVSTSLPVEPPRTTGESPRKKLTRTNVPTTDQIASLNLQEGQNMVNFVFSTRVLGCQKVEAHIYLWKWNTQIVISDVDGTITKSDVLGQFMPLVGRDWTHSGIARLFCAIKENGYQLLFLSARAIVQSYLTKSFLFNLKQDGKSLPTGPVVISPDGLFPSLYREVIRRAPHEFKIACLEDIKALFPPGYNPFYAGFGNRDTDELSYRKIGIPKGKIFIINPKGEVAINNRIDVKSYTSLHTLVHDMFPPTSLVEQDCLPAQEDYNQWNYWKMPLPSIDD